MNCFITNPKSGMKTQSVTHFKISGGPLDGSLQSLSEPMTFDHGSFRYAECDGQGYQVVEIIDGVAFMLWMSPEEIDRKHKEGLGKYPK